MIVSVEDARMLMQCPASPAGRDLMDPSQQFHERLASELSELCARLAAEHCRCVASMEGESVRLKGENAFLLNDNSRLRDSNRGGDPDSAAGCPKASPSLSRRASEVRSVHSASDASISSSMLAPQAPPIFPEPQPPSPTSQPVSPSFFSASENELLKRESSNEAPKSEESGSRGVGSSSLSLDLAAALSSSLALAKQPDPPEEPQVMLGILDDEEGLANPWSSAECGSVSSDHKAKLVIEEPKDDKPGISIVIDEPKEDEPSIKDDEEFSSAPRSDSAIVAAPREEAQDRKASASSMCSALSSASKFATDEPPIPMLPMGKKSSLEVPKLGPMYKSEPGSSAPYVSEGAGADKADEPEALQGLRDKLSQLFKDPGEEAPKKVWTSTQIPGSPAPLDLEPSPKRQTAESALNSHRRQRRASTTGFLCNSRFDTSKFVQKPCMTDIESAANSRMGSRRPSMGPGSQEQGAMSALFGQVNFRDPENMSGNGGSDSSQSDPDSDQGEAGGAGADHVFAVHDVFINKSFRARTQSVVAKPQGAYPINPRGSHDIKEGELKLEEAGQNTRGICSLMIHPSSLMHISWDLVGLVLIGLDCVTVPLEVFDPPQFILTMIMMWISRIFWTVHIYVSFCTGILLPEGNVEMNPRKVAKNYAITWLPFDAFLVIFDWIEVFVGSSNQRTAVIGRLLRSFRMFRTVKLIQMMKTPEFARFLTDNIRSEEVILMAVIAKIMVFMLIVAHLLGCMWYGIGRWQTSLGVSSWLQANEVEDLSLGIRYVWSIHWALYQFTGEAFMSPMNNAERIYTVVVLFFCFMISTYIVSSITTSITRIHLISHEQSRHLAALRRYLQDHRITRSLSTRVENNAQFVLAEQKRTAPESSIELLKVISEPLLVELHFEVNFEVIACHPFFYLYYEVNASAIRQMCHSAASHLSLFRGDVLFHNTEVPALPRMFFPVSGELAYTQEGHQETTVHAHQWLCEHVLWTQWVHVGVLKAVSDSRLLTLDAAAFQKIVTTAGHTEELANYAIFFVKWLNKCQQRKEPISDIGENGTRALERMLIKAFPIEDELDDWILEEGEEDSSDSDSSQREAGFEERGSRRMSQMSQGNGKLFVPPRAYCASLISGITGYFKADKHRQSAHHKRRSSFERRLSKDQDKAEKDILQAVQTFQDKKRTSAMCAKRTDQHNQKKRASATSATLKHKQKGNFSLPIFTGWGSFRPGTDASIVVPTSITPS